MSAPETYYDSLRENLKTAKIKVKEDLKTLQVRLSRQQSGPRYMMENQQMNQHVEAKSGNCVQAFRVNVRSV